MLHFLGLGLQNGPAGVDHRTSYCMGTWKDSQSRGPLTAWGHGKTPRVEVSKPWSRCSSASSWFCVTWTGPIPFLCSPSIAAADPTSSSTYDKSAGHYAWPGSWVGVRGPLSSELVRQQGCWSQRALLYRGRRQEEGTRLGVLLGARAGRILEVGYMRSQWLERPLFHPKARLSPQDILWSSLG